MRIGAFAKTNSLTKDTIRHYMDMGLITPDKTGGQYRFNDKQQRELDDVIKLKRLGFTLSEIKKILVYKMLGRLSPYEAERYYIEIYNEKYNTIIDEIETLKVKADKLKEIVMQMELECCHEVHKFGVDISTLKLLSCRDCKGDFKIIDAHIENNQLMNGKLICGDCSKEIHIVDGIVVVNHSDIVKDEGTKDKQNFFGDYVNEIDDSYLDNIYKMQAWIDNNYDFERLKSKVLLELGSGCGIFLRNIYDYLSEDAVYIAVDHDIERHKFVKYMLSHADIKNNILFICCDFKDVPIKNDSVDVLVDIYGSSNYAFDNENFLLEGIRDYLKDSHLLLATYILFSKFDINSLIDKNNQRFFIKENVINYLKNTGYNIEQSNETKIATKGGKYEDYFLDSEEVYVLGLFGSHDRR